MRLRLRTKTAQPLPAVMQEAMKNGETVQCYGYYSVFNKAKWYYVVYKKGTVTYTGFCSSNYLKKA